MKQSDVLMIAVIGIFAGVFSLVLSSVMFSSDGKKELTAQKVDAINANFQTPDERYFNPKSINPTQLIQIGDNNNAQPF